MDERSQLLRATLIAICVLAGFTIVLLSMTPISSPIAEYYPNVLFAFCFAILIRDPDVLPIWTVTTIFLLRDFVFFEPIGLSAFLFSIAAIVTRDKRKLFAENLLREWASFTLILSAVMILKSLILWILGTSISDQYLILRSITASALVYPIVVGMLWGLFGIERPLSVQKAY